MGLRMSGSRAKVAGVALLEVLIATLLFSFGILAIAGLQAAMTRAQGSAKFRADAVNLGEDLVALVWTDRPHLAHYNQPACEAHKKCAEWLNKVASSLPNGAAEISATPSGAVRVTVTWAVSSEGKHSYALETTVAY